MNGLRLAPVTGYLLGGLILWVAAFSAAYSTAAIVCARGLADSSVMGLSILPFSIGLATLVALAGTGLIGAMAYRRLARTADDSGLAGFVWSLALFMALMAFVGIVWNGLPVVFLATCA